MGTIEDLRKVLQDFLAPELRGISERLESLEKRMEERFAAAEKLTNLRFESLEATIKANHLALMGALDLDRRVYRLEAASKPEDKAHV